SGGGFAGLNVYCDEIYCTRIHHDAGVLITANVGSATVQVGSYAYCGRVVLEDCWSKGMGDVAYEVDAAMHCTLERCHSEEAGGGAAILFTNFNWPALDNGSPPSAANNAIKTQVTVCRDCTVSAKTRTVATGFGAGQGAFAYFCQGSIPYGTLIVEDCE